MPTLRERIRNLVGRKPDQTKQAGMQVPLIWPAWRQGVPHWQIIDLQNYILEGFNLNTLIYSAIMYKVRALRGAPMRAYTGDADQPERLPADDPLAKLVARPNVSQSWMTFHGQNVVYLNVAGNVYIWMIRPRSGGTPEQMYSLRPDRVFIIPNPDKKTVIGYMYVPEGEAAWGSWDVAQRRQAIAAGRAVPILPQDMAHVKLPNPGDPLDGMGYGLSPLAPLAQSADVDNNVTKFLKSFFESGAMVTGLLKYTVPMDDTTVAQARARWKEIYGGVDNWDVAVLDQGGDYQKIGLTFDEMGFETLDDRNESRILGPLGVPGILIETRLGLNRAINANAKELRAMCWQDTLLPENALFEDELQYFLQTDAGGFVAFDYAKVDALKKDIAPLVDSYAKLWSTGVPANMAARTVGLEIEEIPGGNTSYLPLNVVPVSSDAGKPAQSQAGAPEAEEQAPAGKALMVRQFEQAMVEFQAAMQAEDVDQVDKAAIQVLYEIKGILLAQRGGGGHEIKISTDRMTLENKQEPPIVNVSVNPTPFTFAPNIEPTPFTFAPSIEPTPVTIENEVSVEPTPVTVESRPNIFPPAQPVTLKVANTTSVVRRDSAGRIAEIENRPEVEVR